MLENTKNTELNHFRKHADELEVALNSAVESACNGLDFDVRCLDWFSYSPDFFIQEMDVKAA